MLSKVAIFTGIFVIFYFFKRISLIQYSSSKNAVMYYNTVNSHLADTPLLQTPAIMDKIQPSTWRKL